MQHSRRANHIPHELTTKHHHVWGFPQLISSRGNPSPTASHNRQDDSDAGHSNLPSSAFDCSWNGGWEQDGPGLATNSIFFSLLSGKNHLFAGKANQWPLIREDIFLFHSFQQLPFLGFGPLKGFMSWHGVLHGPSTLSHHYFRNFRNIRVFTVGCSPSGVPR